MTADCDYGDNPNFLAGLDDRGQQYVVAVRTDFRGGGDDLPGQALPTINLMLAQAVAGAVHLPGPSVATSSTIGSAPAVAADWP